jgi:hypothetical protein
MKRMVIFGLIFIILTLLICACTQAGTPEVAVEEYLDALAAKDSARIQTLSCTSWQADAAIEVDSLQTVGTELDSVSCSTTSESAEGALVNCTGLLKMSYNGEPRELDLSRQTYRVVPEGGEWLVCGYDG